MKHRQVWYARGGAIAQCGPFRTQAEAAAAMLLVGSKPGKSLFPPDVFVWPATRTSDGPRRRRTPR